MEILNTMNQSSSFIDLSIQNSMNVLEFIHHPLKTTNVGNESRLLIKTMNVTNFIHSPFSNKLLGICPK